MKIFYVSSMPLEYNTSATLRNLALIKGLMALGHQVDSFTTEPSQNFISFDEGIAREIQGSRFYVPLPQIYSACTSKKNTTGIKNSDRIIGDSDRSISNSDRSISKSYRSRSNGSGSINHIVRQTVKKIIRQLYYYVNVFDPMKTAVKNLNEVKIPDDRYDLLISSSDPLSSHLLAKELVSKCPNKFAKWVQYWGDPVLLNIEAKSKAPEFIIKRVEKGLLSQADRVVYVSPLTADAQKRLYPAQAKKIAFVPGAYFDASPSDNKSVGESLDTGPLRLGYFGDYYLMNRDILPLCQTVAEAGAELLVVGNGDVDLTGRKGITAYPREGYQRVKELEEQSDVLVCLCNKRGTQIPGKLYHYAATSKPILVLLHGESMAIKEYLSSFQRYLLCENKPDSIRESLADISSGNYTVSCEPSPHFEPKRIAARFLEVVE